MGKPVFDREFLEFMFAARFPRHGLRRNPPLPLKLPSVRKSCEAPCALTGIHFSQQKFPLGEPKADPGQTLTPRGLPA